MVRRPAQGLLAAGGASDGRPLGPRVHAGPPTREESGGGSFTATWTPLTGPPGAGTAHRKGGKPGGARRTRPPLLSGRPAAGCLRGARRATCLPRTRTPRAGAARADSAPLLPWRGRQRLPEEHGVTGIRMVFTQRTVLSSSWWVYREDLTRNLLIRTNYAKITGKPCLIDDIPQWEFL